MIELFATKYTSKEWFSIKLPFVIFWFMIMTHVLEKGYRISVPRGICGFIDCSFFIEEPHSTIMLVIGVILGIVYLFEIKMKWTTLLLFILTMLVFSAEESSGVLSRSGMFSFIFLAQSIAYWLNDLRFDITALNRNRVQFSMQAIAVAYFLSACSKLLDTGILWPVEGQRITLQIIKSFNYNWVTNLDSLELESATFYLDWINQNQSLLIALLSISLFLEFFTPLAIIRRGYARIYGFCLLGMHIGIYYFMDIIIMTFVVPMVIVFINPFYMISVLIKNGSKFFRRLLNTI